MITYTLRLLILVCGYFIFKFVKFIIEIKDVRARDSSFNDAMGGFK